MNGILGDVRLAFRSMSRDRWLAATAITALTLGIAVTAAGFSIIHGAFIRGPFEGSDHLLVLTWQTRAGRRALLSHDEFERFRAGNRSFADLAAVVDERVNLGDEAAFPEELNAARVTVNGFGLVGQRPVLGRDFTAADGNPGAEPVVIISQGLWQRRFGGVPGVLGLRVRVDGRPSTIIGVMTRGIGSPEGTELWMPLAAPGSEAARARRELHVVGRLKQDVPVRAAGAEIDGIAARMAADGGEATRDLIGARLETFPERYVGGAAAPIFMALMGAATFVLLIVCANVANLLLSRSAARAREMAMRMAIGATRWRIVRQLLVESLVLSVVGAGLGLLLARLALPWLDAALVGRGAPFWIRFTVDGAVAAFVAGVCVATAIAVSLAPAVQASRARSHDLIKEGGRGASAGRGARRFGGAMVVAELALTVVLLAGAGLMVRSFVNTQMVDLGFDSGPLLTMRVRLLESRYETAERRRAFVDRLMPQLQSIPGVEAAVLTNGVPPFDGGERLVEVDGAPGAAAAQPEFASTVAIMPQFFDVLGVGLLDGRRFDDRDGGPGAVNVIVNERFARQYFGEGSPLGRQLRFTTRNPRPGQPQEAWRTIVGVSPSLPHGSPQDRYEAAVVYLPYREEMPAAGWLLLRTRLPAASVAEAARRAVVAIDRDQPVPAARTLEDLLDDTRWPLRVFGSLFAIFAVIALILSSVGLYAVTAYSVTQRTAEIGVRMAIGAAGRDVRWLVLRRGLIQLAFGLAAGLGGALALGRVLRRALIGVTPADPLTLAAITALLVTVSLAACLVPARRAARIDPMAALRE